MKIEIGKAVLLDKSVNWGSVSAITVIREENDKKYYGKPSPNRWGSAESNLLHAIKVKLNSMGYDLIKKRMGKDGNLVDDNQQYLRSRNLKKKDAFCIYDNLYAVRDMAEDWNKEGKVKLSVYHFPDRSNLPENMQKMIYSGPGKEQ